MDLTHEIVKSREEKTEKRNCRGKRNGRNNAGVDEINEERTNGGSRGGIVERNESKAKKE